MIKEIVQFVGELPEDSFSKNLKPKEGLYMFLEVEEKNGTAVLRNVDKEGRIVEEDFNIWNNKLEITPFFNNCLQIQLNTLPVSPRKTFNPDKKIFNSSCSPFVLAFTKKIYKKYEKDKGLLRGQLRDQYFKYAEKYLFTDYQKKLFLPFKNFLVENLFELLEHFAPFNEIKDSFSVNIYCKKVDFTDILSTHAAYLTENVFNKAEYNIEYNGNLKGISDSLSGFNNKKRFLQHKTGFVDLNYRINGEEAQLLWKFFKLQQNKQLPNPTPVFIDKEELDLNIDLVSFYQDDKILSYQKLISSLIEKHKKQLHNFYLIFFQTGLKGSKVIDLDFVPEFHYEFPNNINFIVVFQIGDRFKNIALKNVFDLLYNVFNKAFNNQLIQNKKDGNVWVKFFDELEANPKYHFTDNIVNLMYKYRQAIYDYIYKSRHQSITCQIFDDIMLTSILDDIKHDETDSNGYSTRGNSIKEKLNIWFNLWNFFANNQIREHMVNKTVEIISRLKQIAENDNEHIQSSEEFAFAIGQVIWKILIKSKSGNRSHALLEPFLQKIEAIELKRAVARTFDTYKHEFPMYSKKYGFDKIMSEVMGFEPVESNMKNLNHMILAGYFADSIFNKEQ